MKLMRYYHSKSGSDSPYKRAITNNEEMDAVAAIDLNNPSHHPRPSSQVIVL